MAIMPPRMVSSRACAHSRDKSSTSPLRTMSSGEPSCRKSLGRFRGRRGATSIKTKAEIVEFLKGSFAYIHKAIASMNEKMRPSL